MTGDRPFRYSVDLDLIVGVIADRVELEDGEARFTVEKLAYHLANALKFQDPDFDYDRFLRASGVWRLQVLVDFVDPLGADAAPTPYVAIGAGEQAPWEHLSLNCPDCGEGPLPLQDSEPRGLHFISHCGKTWMRGPVEL